MKLPYISGTDPLLGADGAHAVFAQVDDVVEVAVAQLSAEPATSTAHDLVVWRVPLRRVKDVRLYRSHDPCRYDSRTSRC